MATTIVRIGSALTGTSFDKNKNANDIVKFLNKQNIGPPIEVKKCKTLLMMDATASMGPLLQRVKDKIKYMFRMVQSCLIDNKYTPE